jgi:hypothetical protein
MINKSVVMVFCSIALIFTSAHALDLKDGWSIGPLTTKNSNEWRKRPYISKISDSWRNSPLSARQFESKLRWDRDSWQKSPINWMNSSYKGKLIDSSKWQNRWDKRNWNYGPLNWRNSELRYKNTIRKYGGGLVLQEIKEWIPSDRETTKMFVAEKNNEHPKPQIETMREALGVISEKATHNLSQTKNYLIVYDGKNSLRINMNLKKYILSAHAGQIEVYSSGARDY